MRKVNITFQIHSKGVERWEQAPIIYALLDVPTDMNISNICDSLSVSHGGVTIRTARLYLDEPLTAKQVCLHSGGYHSNSVKSHTCSCGLFSLHSIYADMKRWKCPGCFTNPAST